MAVAFGVAGPRFHQDPAGTTITASYPATVNAGDLIVMQIITNGGTGVTGPAGWTDVHDEATVTNPKGGVWVKIADGTEGGTTIAVTQGSVTSCGMMWTYTGVDPATPLDTTPGTISNTTAVATVVMPSITTVTAGAMLVFATGGNSGTSRSVGPAGATERFDFGTSGGTSTKAGALYDEPFPTPGATGTRTTSWTDSAGVSVTRAGWGVLFALRPATAASPSPQTATPAAVTLAATAGTPVATTITRPAPAGIALAAAAGTPTLAAAASVAPSGVSLSAAEGTPTAGTAVLTAAAGIGLLASAGTPAATTATLTALPGIGLTAAEGTPVVSTAVLSAPSGVQLAAGAGTPVAGTAVLTTTSGVGLLAVAGTPEASQTTPGTNSAPAGVGLQAIEGAPAVTTRATVQPAGIALAATPAVPLLGSSVRALPASAGAITHAGTPSLSTGLTAAPSGIVISAAPGNPSRIFSFAQTARPAGKRLAAGAGTPTAAIYSRIVVGIIVETKRWAASARAVKKAEADSSYTRPATKTVTRWEGKPYESR